MAAFVNCRHFLTRATLRPTTRRLVSTGSKSKSSQTVAAESVKTEIKQAEKHKNWIHYGFDANAKEADRNAMHSVMFISVTCVLVGGFFYWAYMPDYSLNDWAQRQAYIELRRRERNNLPLVDPNLVDPAKISLPSDEELGNTEIII